MAEAVGVLPGSPDALVSAETNGDSAAHLKDLAAQATLKYSVKDYNAAAELYSQATELQAEINGEMSSENADLLYAYGRCLYHVAVKNSNVLGSKVAGEKPQEGLKKSNGKKQKKEKVGEIEDPEKRIAEEVVTKVVEEKDGPIQPEPEADKASKAYFQFTGDENWDTSDEEEESAEEDGEGADADEEDDFVNAYEVLDLARVLLLKKIEEVESSGGKGKEKGQSQEVHQFKERLADTYDLQAEISLEGERFPMAVVDLKSALELKKALFPQESSLVAEAHYKLSLALEFSSVTQQKNENGEIEAGTEAVVDEAMREEAVQQMEAAIASCKMRIRKEEVNLQNGDHEANSNDKKPKVTKRDVDDVREMVKEMEERLVELRQPPVSLNDPSGMGTLDGSNPLSGILGSILGESPAAQKARLEEASKGATDLTNLVKRKKPAETEASRTAETEVHTNGKRKVDFAQEMEEVGTGKRAKISDDDRKPDFA